MVERNKALKLAGWGALRRGTTPIPYHPAYKHTHTTDFGDPKLANETKYLPESVEFEKISTKAIDRWCFYTSISPGLRYIILQS